MTDTINLQKGGRADLTKTNPGLTIAHIGCGWDAAAPGGATIDLDAFAIILKDGKLYPGNAIVYFNHKTEAGIEHMGDNLTGVGDGDDETIKIDLSKVPADVTEVVIAVNIFEADKKKQNFGMVNNAFIRVYDPANPTNVIVKYDLSEDHSSFNGMVLGSLYRKDGEWKFRAIGEGKNGSIIDISNAYA